MALGRHVEKGGQPFDPLFQQLPAVHQNQRVDARRGDEPGRHHGLAKGRGGRQHAGVVRRQRIGRHLLLRAQLTVERRTSSGVPPKRSSRSLASIPSEASRASASSQAAPRQREVLRAVLSAIDDARFAEGGQPHGLRPVELRVLERRQTDQAVAQVPAGDAP